MRGSYTMRAFLPRETRNLWQFTLWNGSNLQKFTFIDRNFLNLQKELKEVAGEYCTDEGVELLILTKVFIYCKQNSRNANHRNHRLSHFYRKMFD